MSGGFSWSTSLLWLSCYRFCSRSLFAWSASLFLRLFFRFLFLRSFHLFCGFFSNAFYRLFSLSCLLYFWLFFGRLFVWNLINCNLWSLFVRDFVRAYWFFCLSRFFCFCSSLFRLGWLFNHLFRLFFGRLFVSNLLGFLCWLFCRSLFVHRLIIFTLRYAYNIIAVNISAKRIDLVLFDCFLICLCLFFRR